jgi:hypothetical protein
VLLATPHRLTPADDENPIGHCGLLAVRRGSMPSLSL